MVERITSREGDTDEQRAFAEKWWRENEGKHYGQPYYPGDLCPNYKRPEETK